MLFNFGKQARSRTNLVNRTPPQLLHQLYQSKIATHEESSTFDVTFLMGTSFDSRNEMQGLANKYTNGDMDSLVNSMNGFVVAVCEYSEVMLPILLSIVLCSSTKPTHLP